MFAVSLRGLVLTAFVQAQERQESQFRAPKQRVEDFEELHEYRGRKREEKRKRDRWKEEGGWSPSVALLEALYTLRAAGVRARDT